MKNHLFKLLFVFSVNAFAQSTYVWNGATSDFTVPTNWAPTRSSPAPTDILVFNNGSTNLVTNVPSQTIGQLKVQSNTTVNLQAGASGNTLTISGGTGTDLIVEAGSALRIQGTNVCTLSVSTGATAEIYGTIYASNAAHRYLSANMNSFLFKNGSQAVAETGFDGSMFGTTGTANTTIFEAGSAYIYKDGDNPFGLSAPSSKVVFQLNSKYIHQHPFNAPASSGRTYAIFEMDHPSFNSNLTGGSTMTCQKIIVKQANNLKLNLTGLVFVNENIEVLSGTLTRSSSGALTVNGSIILNGGNMNYTSTGALTIGGNLDVLSPSSSFNLTPTLTSARNDIIGGNLNNAGTVIFNPTVTPPNYNLVFQNTNSTPQNITNNGTLIFSPTVMVSLPDADGYTLGSDIHIQGILNLPTNNVKINANGYTVTLGLNNTFPGFLNVTTNPSYFYNGKFRRYFATSTTTGFVSGGFPIGIASDVQPCTILMTTAPTSGGFITAEFISSFPGTNGLPLTIGAINVTRVYAYGFYRIIADASLAGYVYTFQMVGTNYYGVGDYEQLVLLKRANSSSPWTDGGGTQGVPFGTNAQFTLSLSGLTSFSDFVVGGNEVPNPLPVLFKQFIAQRFNHQNYLSWIVENVQEIEKFEVQKSYDLTHFETISEINTSNSNIYDFIDPSENHAPKTYYRVKAILSSGLTAVTETIELKLTPETKVEVYQNPFNHELKLKVESDTEAPMQIKLIDISGKELLNQFFEIKTGNQIFEMNTNSLSSGVYLIQVQFNDQVYVHKLLK